MARLSGLKNTKMVDSTFRGVHQCPSTNLAQRSLTPLMWPTLLPQRQTSHHY